VFDFRFMQDSAQTEFLQLPLDALKRPALDGKVFQCLKRMGSWIHRRCGLIGWRLFQLRGVSLS
jgi:hypothetical protein